ARGVGGGGRAQAVARAGGNQQVDAQQRRGGADPYARLDATPPAQGEQQGHQHHRQAGEEGRDGGRGQGEPSRLQPIAGGEEESEQSADTPRSGREAPPLRLVHRSQQQGRQAQPHGVEAERRSI